MPSSMYFAVLYARAGELVPQWPLAPKQYISVTVQQYPNSAWAQYYAEYPHMMYISPDHPKTHALVTQFSNKVGSSQLERSLHQAAIPLYSVWPSGNCVITVEYHTPDENLEIVRGISKSIRVRSPEFRGVSGDLFPLASCRTLSAHLTSIVDANRRYHSLTRSGSYKRPKPRCAVCQNGTASISTVGLRVKTLRGSGCDWLFPAVPVTQYRKKKDSRHAGQSASDKENAVGMNEAVRAAQTFDLGARKPLQNLSQPGIG